MRKKVVSKFGYGEDSFTFIALNYRLDEILEKLGDKSDPEVFFYRPSLGRGLNVGEFDGIISTKNAIFLIEAKWMNRPRRTAFSLSVAQRRRHEIFSGLIKLWCNYAESHGYPTCWNDFDSNLSNWDRKNFRTRYNGKFPAEDTLLSRNIFFIMDSIKPLKKTLSNVLLVHKTIDYPYTCDCQEPGFRQIILKHDVLSDTGFADLP
jgi:hypothetical protein